MLPGETWRAAPPADLTECDVRLKTGMPSILSRNPAQAFP
jgi:hypothetical protein